MLFVSLTISYNKFKKNKIMMSKDDKLDFYFSKNWCKQKYIFIMFFKYKKKEKYIHESLLVETFVSRKITIYLYAEIYFFAEVLCK